MKNCFVYMLGPEPRHLTDLIHSLQLLQRNYLDRFPTDVLVFHEGAFPQQLQLQQNMVESASPHCAGVPIKWVRVFHQTPPDVDLSKTDTSRFSLNYRHMIRFMMNELFCHPALDGYDYLCRLDTDSFILSPVQVNLFDEMRSRDARYGFMNDVITEVPEYTVGKNWKNICVLSTTARSTNRKEVAMRVCIRRHGKRTAPRPATKATRAWAGGYGQVAALIAAKRFKEQKVQLREARELCDDVVDGMRK